MLWYPVGAYIQLSNWLVRIIRLQIHTKMMLSLHTLMHHELQLNGCGASRLDGHRTDDGCRRSTPFQHLHFRDAQDTQRLVAYVLDVVSDLHHRIQLLITQVIEGLLNLDGRRPTHLGFKTRGRAVGCSISKRNDSSGADYHQTQRSQHNRHGPLGDKSQEVPLFLSAGTAHSHSF